MDEPSKGTIGGRDLYLVAFTKAGCELARHIASGMGLAGAGEPGGACRVQEVVTTDRLATETGLSPYGPSLSAWAAGRFAQGAGLVFVGATGIAVRAIAPLVRDKMSDPAVVSVDERGGFVVPLLSGHVGGANDLARAIARITGGQAVISTATDVNGTFAVDAWAQEQGLVIVERQLAKEVSARLLAGDPVGLASDLPVEGTLPAGLVATDGPEGQGSDASDLPLGICIGFDGEKAPFPRTLHLLPRAACLGVGCRRGLDPAVLAQRVRASLAGAGVDPACVARLATIDLKADEPAIVSLAQGQGWDLATFSAEDLAALPGDFTGSDFVLRTVGVDNVCERAAVAAAGGGRLLRGKEAGEGATVAIALADPGLAWPREAGEGEPAGDGREGASDPDSCAESGKAADSAPSAGSGGLWVVGLGPGAADDLTLRARKALLAADLLVGYPVYVDLVRDLLPDTPALTTPMRGEVQRCRMALEEAAQGRRVALVCSGDPGIYGMAGLCLELEDQARAEGRDPVPIEVIPGVTAANGGAAVLGAPLTCDFAVISLSDLLTPRDLIRRRLEAAAQADLVVVLYNPSSRKRADYLRRACDVILAHRPAQTPCGIVRNIGREGQSWEVMTLADLREAPVDMFTTVFVGNAVTRLVGGRMVTVRGYDLGGEQGAGDQAVPPGPQTDSRPDSQPGRPGILARLLSLLGGRRP